MTDGEILLERRVRAAELALSTTRKLYLQSEQENGQLEHRIQGLREELTRLNAAREQVERDFAARLTAATQVAGSERIRREELEHALGRAERHRTEQDELARTLAAERRADALAGEVEVLRRRAAEFEYGVRVALTDAFKLLSELTGRVRAVIDAVGPEGPRSPADAPADGQPLDAGRLDAALDRLRAQIPPPDAADDDQ